MLAKKKPQKPVLKTKVHLSSMQGYLACVAAAKITDGSKALLVYHTCAGLGTVLSEQLSPAVPALVPYSALVPCRERYPKRASAVR